MFWIAPIRQKALGMDLLFALCKSACQLVYAVSESHVASEVAWEPLGRSAIHAAARPCSSQNLKIGNPDLHSISARVRRSAWFLSRDPRNPASLARCGDVCAMYQPVATAVRSPTTLGCIDRRVLAAACQTILCQFEGFSPAVSMARTIQPSSSRSLASNHCTSAGAWVTQSTAAVSSIELLL